MSTKRIGASLQAAIEAERGAEALFRQFVKDNADALRLIAHLGDGKAGHLASIICEEVGIPYFSDSLTGYRKVKIPRALAKAVMERDAYRCVECGDHHDLTCDHEVPESKGGATTLENLRTMCRPCNSRKGAR